MNERIGNDRAVGAVLLAGAVVVMALIPVWAPAAVVWLLATGRSMRSCGRDANRISGEAQA